MSKNRVFYRSCLQHTCNIVRRAVSFHLIFIDRDRRGVDLNWKIVCIIIILLIIIFRSHVCKHRLFFACLEIKNTPFRRTGFPVVDNYRYLLHQRSSRSTQLNMRDSLSKFKSNTRWIIHTYFKSYLNIFILKATRLLCSVLFPSLPFSDQILKNGFGTTFQKKKKKS